MVKTIAQTESKACVLFNKLPLNHDCPTAVEVQVVLVHRPFLVHDFSTVAVGVLVVALSNQFPNIRHTCPVKHLRVVFFRQSESFSERNYAKPRASLCFNSTNAFASRNVKKLGLEASYSIHILQQIWKNIIFIEAIEYESYRKTPVQSRIWLVFTYLEQLKSVNHENTKKCQYLVKNWFINKSTYINQVRCHQASI